MWPKKEAKNILALLYSVANDLSFLYHFTVFLLNACVDVRLKSDLPEIYSEKKLTFMDSKKQLKAILKTLNFCHTNLGKTYCYVMCGASSCLNKFGLFLVTVREKL